MDPSSTRTITADDAGNAVLHVVTRRRYALPAFDGAIYDGQPEALRGEAGPRPGDGDGDLLAVARPGTDVHVRARAYSLDGPVRALDVAVIAHRRGSAAPSLERRLRVIGDRCARRARDGALAFGETTPFTEMDLAWERAFGGADAAAADVHRPEPYETPESIAARFAYARNPVGCGYVVDAASLGHGTLRLPNIEDPEDLVTAERLALGDATRWPLAPIASGFLPVPGHWWPRSAWLGFGAPTDESPARFVEVQRGWIPVGHVAPASLDDIAARRDDRWFHTAAPGMCAATMHGDERFVLEGLHPHRRRLAFALPGEVPVVSARFGDAVLRLAPALRTVDVDVEAGIVDLVWCARAALGTVTRRSPFSTLTHEVLWPRADR